MYYILLIGIRNFNVLIDNKPFFYLPLKSEQEAYEKLADCQGTMTMQYEAYRITHITKIIIYSLERNYQDKKVQISLSK